MKSKSPPKFPEHTNPSGTFIHCVCKQAAIVAGLLMATSAFCADTPATPAAPGEIDPLV